MSPAPRDQGILLHEGVVVEPATTQKLFAEYRKDFFAYSKGAMTKLNKVETSIAVSAQIFALGFLFMGFCSWAGWVRCRLPPAAGCGPWPMQSSFFFLW
jgi:hypothetical protein